MALRAPMAMALAASALSFLACGSHHDATGDDGDASFQQDFDGGAHDGNIPSPDAIVLFDGGGAPPDTGGTEDSAPPPGSCVGKSDGTVCVTSSDPCLADATCKGGLCGGLTTRADGFNYQAGDDTARCCGGKPVKVNTDANCGACGIKCNLGNGESCALLGGHYFCRGCVASAQCWSRCCSLSFSPSSCAASDCAGNCSAQFCPPGTHCVVGGGASSDYCAY